MKQFICIVLFVCFLLIKVQAQNVGIGTQNPDASAQLDVSSTTRGFLPPRMTALERIAIASPAEGLLVYDMDLNSLLLYTGTSWVRVGPQTTILQRGNHIVGASNSGQTTTTLNFPGGVFVGTPTLIATVKHDQSFNVNDAFSVTIKDINATQAVLIVRRVDANASWSQNLTIDWLAIR